MLFGGGCLFVCVLACVWSRLFACFLIYFLVCLFVCFVNCFLSVIGYSTGPLSPVRLCCPGMTFVVDWALKIQMFVYLPELGTNPTILIHMIIEGQIIILCYSRPTYN